MQKPDTSEISRRDSDRNNFEVKFYLLSKLFTMQTMGSGMISSENHIPDLTFRIINLELEIQKLSEQNKRLKQLVSLKIWPNEICEFGIDMKN